MSSLAGRLCAVTGGTRGIGRAVVERLLDDGAELIVTARSTASGADLLAAHPDVTFVVADASKPTELNRVVDAANGRPIQAVIANVGGGPATWVATSPEEDFDEVMALNVKSAFFTVQKLLPLLQRGSAVVLVSSIAGLGGDPGAIVYNASKAAVRSLARSMTAELSDRGIRVNAVSPGPTSTEGFDGYIADHNVTREDIVPQLPVGHIGQPSEVAAAVVFLASDESSYIAGAELVVDGGMSQV